MPISATKKYNLSALKTHYKPKVIMSIHGYKSKGRWQDSLSEVIQAYGYESAPYRYGYKLFRIMRHHIRKDVENFRDWYFSIVENPVHEMNISEPFHRPSIIAHSLGTWIVAKALLKYPEIKFDKIFLLGSIIPADFDWFKLILRAQVNSVIYEKAKKDTIAPLGWIFTGSIRPCGTKGFVQKSSFIKEEEFSEFGHSDFNYKAHFKEYIMKRLVERPHQLSVISGRDLSEREIKKYFKDTIRIDRYWFSNEYSYDEIPMATAIDWFRIEKDIWSFAVNSYNNKVLGYINAVPVNNDTYNRFSSGELHEKDIRAEQIQDYDTSTEYNLIILSVATRKSLNDTDTAITKGRLAEMLIMSFIYKISKHKAGKNNLKKMAAFAWSAEGQKLCEGFCMKKKNGLVNGKEFFELDFSTLKASDVRSANFMSDWWYRRILKVN